MLGMDSMAAMDRTPVLRAHLAVVVPVAGDATYKTATEEMEVTEARHQAVAVVEVTDSRQLLEHLAVQGAPEEMDVVLLLHISNELGQYSHK
jgi:hypothetical protein